MLNAIASLERFAGSPSTLVLSVPAPRVAPETLLAVCPQATGFLWDPGHGTAAAGVGAVHQIRARGEDRFDAVIRQAGEVWARLVPLAEKGCKAPEPRLFGGFAFSPGAADQDAWGGFGDACFTLPRLLYATCGPEATLSLAVRGDELASPAARASFVRELVRVLEALRFPGRSTCGARAVITPPDRARFRHEVAAIRAAIAAGRVQKIVAAHRARVRLGTPLAVHEILARLTDSAPGAIRFAFIEQGAAFLGATPERLLSRHGRRVTAEALAGSSASGAEHARALLASAKDRHEHQLVVETILDRLVPYCDELRAAPTPVVRELGEVQHLLTPINGTLAAPTHLLELAAALHPTPAVSGVPSAAALEWISTREAASRGWYAAPIGWLDAQGDGELAVALRCCLLKDREAFVYAGAGIVAGSDPDRELAETELKMKTLLNALTNPVPGDRHEPSHSRVLDRYAVDSRPSQLC